MMTMMPDDRHFHSARDLALADAAALLVDREAELVAARADVDTYRELLSMAFEQVAALTTRCQRQTAHIRRMMGLPEPDTWHPPIRLEDVPAGDVPAGLVRAREIRWRPFDGDETR